MSQRQRMQRLRDARLVLAGMAATMFLLGIRDGRPWTVFWAGMSLLTPILFSALAEHLERKWWQRKAAAVLVCVEDEVARRFPHLSREEALATANRVAAKDPAPYN